MVFEPNIDINETSLDVVLEYEEIKENVDQ